MPFLIADVVVVEAGAGLAAGGGGPVFDDEAAVLLEGDQIVADGRAAVGCVHVPVANPEIEFAEFGPTTGRHFFDERREFRIIFPDGKFRR